MPKAVSDTTETWEQLRPLLDGELKRLPEKYRLPLVLCYLEGKTHEEAARPARLYSGASRAGCRGRAISCSNVSSGGDITLPARRHWQPCSRRTWR